jgi:hypothetical protein
MATWIDFSNPDEYPYIREEYGEHGVVLYVTGFFSPSNCIMMIL